MRARYERQARQLQDQVKELEADLAEREQGAERARASLGETPRLRDRNKLVHVLLNSDVDVYERVAPRWREYRQGVHKANQIRRKVASKRARIKAAVGRGVEDEYDYRVLRAKVSQEEQARSACKRMLESIGSARRRIETARRRRPWDEVSRTAADLDASEVSDLIRTVRKHAIEVNEKVSPHPSFDANLVLKLDGVFPGGTADHKVRLQKYKAAKILLDSLEKGVKSLLGDIAAREKAADDQRRRYVNEASARFTENTS